MTGENDPAYDLNQVLPAEARDALRHLEIFARKMADGLLHGAHQSRRKGVSTEFDHHKLYQPGDPIKHVDWKASARHERYYVKRYIEDTALRVRLVVDGSGSLNQQTDPCQVYLQVARLAASMAYLIVRQRDSVGMVMSRAGSTRWLPCSSTQRQLVQILRMLASARPEAGDNLEDALRAVLERDARRGMIVLVSDLLFDPEPVRREIRRLQARGHEVLVLQVRDPAVETFPYNRWMQFDSLERPGVRYRLDTVPLKRFYLEEFQLFMDGWHKWTKRHDVHFLSLRSDESIEGALATYMALRAGRGMGP